MVSQGFSGVSSAKSVVDIETAGEVMSDSVPKCSLLVCMVGSEKAPLPAIQVAYFACVASSVRFAGLRPHLTPHDEEWEVEPPPLKARRPARGQLATSHQTEPTDPRTSYVTVDQNGLPRKFQVLEK